MRYLALFIFITTNIAFAQLPKFSVYEEDMRGVTCQAPSFVPESRQAVVNKLKQMGLSARSLMGYSKFTKEHLLDFYYAAKLIPERINLFQNSDWKEIRIIYRPNLKAVANAFITIGPMWFEFSSLHRRAIILHELFHRLSTRHNDLSYSQKWIGASQSFLSARWVGRRWRMDVSGEENFVSIYAMTNPSEDFAETVNQYRVNPFKLMSEHPLKYNFIKDVVFLGQEFINDSQCDFDPTIINQKLIEKKITEFVTLNKKQVRKQMRKSKTLSSGLMALMKKDYIIKIYLENSPSLSFLESSWVSKYL
jgi:hypothetical protein